ncbi:MAG: HlyD family efflux transporter periplasmic adaptor subunit [Planctomycetes bacterium]|nr:HlyD family efflux transporter periplasmic adaptor subunit [Planctomycetota bacterium]
MKRLLLLVPLVIAAILILAWSQRGGGPAMVSGYLEAHDIRLGSRVGGRVQSVAAEEGQAVKAGDVLVRLDPYDLNERLAEAQASRAAQAARLARLEAGSRTEEKDQARAMRDRYEAAFNKLKSGTRPTELQIARDKLAVVEADERKAAYDYEKFQGLASRNEATADELAEKTRAYDAARARAAQARDELKLAEEGPRTEDIAEAAALLANAKAALAMAEAGPRSEEIAEARAMLAAADGRVSSLQRQIAELEIRAPGDGVIEALTLRPGDLVAPNAPVLSMIDSSSLWVRAYVPQNRVGLKIGQTLTVRVDAFPDRKFTGRVTYVASQAEFIPSNAQTPEERSKQVFRIKVELSDGRELLRPGMAADVILE